MAVSTYPATLDSDWASWRSRRMEGRFRRYLDKKRRRLSRAGTIRFTQVKDALELVRLFPHVRQFRAERFKKLRVPDVFARDSVFSFYLHVAIEGASTGRTCTFCLYLDEEPISIVFGVRDENQFTMLLSTFDASCGNLSVGLLALEESVRYCIENGMSVYDFSFGDHEYKIELGAERIPLLELCAPLTMSGHVVTLARKVLREVKRRTRPMVRKGTQTPTPPAHLACVDAPIAACE